MKKINFDNGSTSFPKAPGLGKAISDYVETGAYNINRGNYEKAYEVENLVYQTRGQIAELFGVKKKRNVIFTPGVTYSINYFVHGFLKRGDHILVSSLEHHAVMRPLTQRLNEGITADLIPVDSEGNLAIDEIEGMLRHNTRAILVTHASNVCGTVLPIRRLGQICKDRDLIFAVDAAQTAGSLPLSVQEDAIDFLAFAGHKGLLGPQGIGGFVISDRLHGMMQPILKGGTGSDSDQVIMPSFLPDCFEVGTLNLPGIAGLNHSLQYLMNRGISSIHEKEMELAGQFLDGAARLIPQGIVIGRKDCRNRIAVVSLDFPNDDNARISFELDQKFGIMTRVGLHCAAAAHQALGTFPKGTLRFSFGIFNTPEEVEYCLRALHDIVSE